MRLSTQEAWLLKDGKVVRGPVPITHGKAGHRTPTGTFKVEWKKQNDYSRKYNAPMPYAVYFAVGGIAFHEGRLTEQSHGCIHLSPKDARAFYQRLDNGMQVTVTQ